MEDSDAGRVLTGLVDCTLGFELSPVRRPGSKSLSQPEANIEFVLEKVGKL